jgi:2-deoxy-D-gluconate 3-dehydrogenase
MANDSFRLDGKVAVVTGAGQGIGRAITFALNEAGATVAVTGLHDRRADLNAVCQQITNAGGNATAFDLDVSSTTSINTAFDQIVAQFGQIDVLVNNAGVRANGPSLTLTEADWDRVLAVNLKGAFFCSQAAARGMIKEGGSIVNVASQLVVSAAPERAAYIASKGGMVALTKTLAIEWAQYGITVNAVGPGPTDTPMTASSDQATTDRLAARSPIGRRLLPEEVANSVVFLASSAATAITGQLLMVDGGWTVS